MVLQFPARVRDDAPGTPEDDAERLRQLELPVTVRQLPVVSWARRNRRLLTVAVFTFAVLAFSGSWAGGALVLDGPGISLYVRMALDHLGADRAVPYWLPDLWAGAPIWAVTPTLPIFLLLPLATALGPDLAVKLGVLGLQVFGACGAYVLARSLWRDTGAAVIAGVLFALQPLVLSHGALAGSQPTVGVMAAAPWLVWALRRGLRGEGPGYLAVAGLLAGFAVLMQAEYAIGLALLCGCLLAVEIGRAGTGRNPAGLGRLLARGAAVVAIGLGSVAYWLLPFVSLGKSFILSPAALVQGELFNGSSAVVGSELGVFFGRSGGLVGAVGFNRQGLLPLFFHVGWVGLALTLVTVVFLSRRDRDGTLTAVLLSAAMGVWLSTGVVPLASGGPAGRTQVVPFVVAGLATGLLLGALLRPLRLGRWRPLFVLGAVAFLVAVPYLTPFETLQKVIPLFGSIRFPRFYTVAPLALALGAAYPVVMVREWAERRRTRTTPAPLPAILAAAVGMAVVGAFLVDIWPQRSYYRIRPPATAGAYRQVVARLAEVPGDYRVAPTQVEATAVDSLLDTGHTVTIGWPHFVAGKQMWRLTAEAFLTPNAYRERAWGLSATSFQVTERPTDKGTATEAVDAIDLVPNPRSLPMVRAYSRTVAMATRELTPELAVALAHRNVGVYTGSPEASPALAATTVVDVRSPAPCQDDSGARLDLALASQLGVACVLHTWLDTLFAGVDLLNIGEGVGGTFRATTNRLQGISVYLDRVPDRADLALHELRPGDTLGPELARGKAVGVDEYGMAAFTFDPIADSAGKDYAFVLTCGDCRPDRVPRLVAGHSVDRPGNLVRGGELRRDRAPAFAPIYEAVAADAPSATTVRTNRREPGSWRIVADGQAPALVVVAEAWFPGWEAKVDGRKATLVEADGGFLGVPVDGGSHVITLEYRRPAAATLGRLVTFATLLTVAVTAVRRRRRGAVAAPAPAPGEPPLLVARERPRKDPMPSDEVEWDEVVQPRRPAPAAPPAPVDGDGDGQDPPPAPPRRPGTARWPPEPF
jgi:hypothetical protein